jgi:hypothetical protein
MLSNLHAKHLVTLAMLIRGAEILQVHCVQDDSDAWMVK